MSQQSAIPAAIDPGLISAVDNMTALLETLVGEPVRPSHKLVGPAV